MSWRNATSCTVIVSGCSNRTELQHTEWDLDSALPGSECASQVAAQGCDLNPMEMA
jgi:hypothetical protein